MGILHSARTDAGRADSLRHDGSVYWAVAVKVTGDTPGMNAVTLCAPTVGPSVHVLLAIPDALVVASDALS